MPDPMPTDENPGAPPNLTGFRTHYKGVDPTVMPVFPDRIFMTIVTLALMVGLPAAIAGIFYGIARLGAAWGVGH
jgi:hypothetical protein